MTPTFLRPGRRALLLATALLAASAWAAPDYGPWHERDEGGRPEWQRREEQRQRQQAHWEREQEWQRQQQEELRRRAETQRRRDEAWQRQQEDELRHRAEAQRRRDEAWQRRQEDEQRWRDAQQQQRHGYQPYPMPPQGFAYPGGDYRWERGQRYHGPRQVVHDWRHQQLRPPPAGYQWVRAEGGYLLLAVPTGLILEFVAR